MAQTGRLTGKVTDDRNEAISGASISLSTGGGTTTNVDGFFTLNLAPGKKYEIKISAIGFQPKTEENMHEPE